MPEVVRSVADAHVEQVVAIATCFGGNLRHKIINPPGGRLTVSEPKVIVAGPDKASHHELGHERGDVDPVTDTAHAS